MRSLLALSLASDVRQSIVPKSPFLSSSSQPKATGCASFTSWLLGLQHAPSQTQYSTATGAQKGQRGKAPFIRHSHGLPAPLAGANLAHSWQDLQSLQHIMSKFPSRLTPVHVHSVLAWALDHYEPCERVAGTHAEHGTRQQQKRGNCSTPAAVGGSMTAYSSTLHKEQHTMEDVMRALVDKLQGFQQWDLQLLKACNSLATSRAAPACVREYATTLTAAAAHHVLAKRAWEPKQEQSLACATANALATLSHSQDWALHASKLAGGALDALPSLVPMMNVLSAWKATVSMARLQLCHRPSFEALSKRLEAPWRLRQLSPKELALLAQALAGTGIRNSTLFVGISKVLPRKLDLLNGYDVFNLASALHALNLPHSPLLHALAAAVDHLASSPAAATPLLTLEPTLHHAQTGRPAPPPPAHSHPHLAAVGLPAAESQQLSAAIDVAAHSLDQTVPYCCPNRTGCIAPHAPDSTSCAPLSAAPGPAHLDPISGTVPAAAHAAAPSAAGAGAHGRRRPSLPSSQPGTAACRSQGLATGIAPHKTPYTNPVQPALQGHARGHLQARPCSVCNAPQGTCAPGHPAQISPPEATAHGRLSANNLSAIAQVCLKLHSPQAQPLARSVCGAAAAAMAGALQLQPGLLSQQQQQQQQQGYHHCCHRHQQLQQQQGCYQQPSLHAVGGGFRPLQIIALLSMSAFYKVHSAVLQTLGMRALAHASLPQLQQQFGAAPLVMLLGALSKLPAHPPPPQSPPPPCILQLPGQAAKAATRHTAGSYQQHWTCAPLAMDGRHGSQEQPRAAGAAGNAHPQLLQAVLRQLRLAHNQLGPAFTGTVLQALAALRIRDHSLTNLLLSNLPAAAAGHTVAGTAAAAAAAAGTAAAVTKTQPTSPTPHTACSPCASAAAPPLARAPPPSLASPPALTPQAAPPPLAATPVLPQPLTIAAAAPPARAGASGGGLGGSLAAASPEGSLSPAAAIGAPPANAATGGLPAGVTVGAPPASAATGALSSWGPTGFMPSSGAATGEGVSYIMEASIGWGLSPALEAGAAADEGALLGGAAGRRGSRGGPAAGGKVLLSSHALLAHSNGGGGGGNSSSKPNDTGPGGNLDRGSWGDTATEGSCSGDGRNDEDSESRGCSSDGSDGEDSDSRGCSWEDVSQPVAIRMLRALADLEHQDRHAAHWLATCALHGRGTPGQALALGSLHVPHPTSPPPLRPSQLAHLAWALAKLHVLDPVVWQSLVAHIGHSTHSAQARRWRPQHITQVMWSLGEAFPGDGVAHVPGWDRAVAGVLQAASNHLPRLTPRQLLLIMHGFARVRCTMPALPVVDQVVLQASRCVARRVYSLDDLLVLLWSTVVAGHANHALYDAIAEALLPAVGELQLGRATLAAWCYLRHANYLHPTLTERLLHRCIALLDGGPRQAAGVGASRHANTITMPACQHDHPGDGDTSTITLPVCQHHQPGDGDASRLCPPPDGCPGAQAGRSGARGQEGGHARHLRLLHPPAASSNLRQPGDGARQGFPTNPTDPSQQASQAPPGPHAQGCTAVLLLTLAASFASCQGMFAGVGTLFSSIASRASRMQEQAPLDAAEHEALTRLLAMLSQPAPAPPPPCSSASMPSSPAPVLGPDTARPFRLAGVGGAGSATGTRHMAYPMLPLSLRLTPTFGEEGGLWGLEWEGSSSSADLGREMTAARDRHMPF